MVLLVYMVPQRVLHVSSVRRENPYLANVALGHVYGVDFSRLEPGQAALAIGFADVHLGSCQYSITGIPALTARSIIPWVPLLPEPRFLNASTTSGFSAIILAFLTNPDLGQ